MVVVGIDVEGDGVVEVWVVCCVLDVVLMLWCGVLVVL